MRKLWKSEANKSNKAVFRFTVGRDHLADQVLLPYDLKGSAAHAKGLAKIGILTRKELQGILKILKEIGTKHAKGKIRLRVEDEDMHTFIENYLTRKLGKTGKKIHTGRSRNDQVLTALRLYYRDQLSVILRRTTQFIKTLGRFRKIYGGVKIAGYTHTRKAMPSSLKLWSGAFIESMRDNIAFLLYIGKHTDQSPLGTGAGYGLPLKLDRTFAAKELGFRKIQNNPVYVQNSRGKFETLLLSALTQVMFDVNKIASDLIFFSLPDVGFMEIPEEMTTGSSIMPQKKNPDVPELLRARYHLLVGEEAALKSMSGNLISGFHRDLQLTKEIMIRSFETTAESLNILTLLLSKLKVDKKKAAATLTDELFATEKVYKLVEQGLSFREAYVAVKKSLG